MSQDNKTIINNSYYNINDNHIPNMTLENFEIIKPIFNILTRIDQKTYSTYLEKIVPNHVEHYMDRYNLNKHYDKSIIRSIQELGTRKIISLLQLIHYDYCKDNNKTLEFKKMNWNNYYDAFLFFFAILNEGSNGNNLTIMYIKDVFGDQEFPVKKYNDIISFFLELDEKSLEKVIVHANKLLVDYKNHFLF